MNSDLQLISISTSKYTLHVHRRLTHYLHTGLEHALPKRFRIYRVHVPCLHPTPTILVQPFIGVTSGECPRSIAYVRHGGRLQRYLGGNVLRKLIL